MNDQINPKKIFFKMNNNGIIENLVLINSVIIMKLTMVPIYKL